MLRTKIGLLLLAFGVSAGTAWSQETPPITGRWQEISGAKGDAWRLVTIPGRDGDGPVRISGLMGPLFADSVNSSCLDSDLLSDFQGFANGGYVAQPLKTGSLRRGAGYFVKTRDGDYRIRNITPARTDGSECVSVPVKAGWNLIGNPFVATLRWLPSTTYGTNSLCTVETRYTTLQSQPFIMAADGSSLPIAQGGLINPLAGFWLKCSTDGLIIFRRADLPAGAPAMLSPATGALNVPVRPSFAWKTSAYATSYTLQIAKESGFTTVVYSKTTTGTNAACSESRLDYNTRYYWRVLASNGAGSTTSNPAFFTTELAPPAPGSFSLTSPANGAFNVPYIPDFDWTDSAHADTYQIQVAMDPDFQYLVLDQDGIVGSRFACPTSLDWNWTYYWRVFAKSARGTTPCTDGYFTFVTAGQSAVGKTTVNVE